MSEALQASPTEAVPATIDPKYELARVVEARAVMGYKVESLSETRAVLVVKGRKRFLGMRGGKDQRTEITINDEGRAVTRDI
jgi:hypothetical protein